MIYTLADLCQGHGAGRDCTDYDCTDDHGVISYCDGTCTSAMLEYEYCLNSNRAEQPTATTDSVSLEVVRCADSHSHFVTFEGPDADSWAAAYMQARRSTHAIHEMPTRHFDHTVFPKVAALLYPICGHGMDANSCYGPDHFMSLAQEIALGLH